MKKTFLAALAGLSILSARADVTMVQQIQQEGGGKSGEMQITTKIKGSEARMDVGDQLTNIYNLDSGDVTSLAHAQKVIVKIPADKIKAMQAMQKEKLNTSDPEPLKPTGKKDTINGFACEEYTSKMGDINLTLWVTKDATNGADIMANLDKISNGTDPIANALKKMDVPGFPVRTIVESPSSGKVTSTLVSLKQDPIPDSDFKAPDGYREVNLPAGLGQ